MILISFFQKKAHNIQHNHKAMTSNTYDQSRIPTRARRPMTVSLTILNADDPIAEPTARPAALTVPGTKPTPTTQPKPLPATSGGCTPRATRAMARGSAQKIAEEAQKIAEEE